MHIWLRQVIAASEIVGGLFALAAIISAIRADDHHIGTALLLAVLSALSITAGIQLWRDRQLGYRLSLLLQGAQMLQLRSAALVYRVVLGFQLTVWVREGVGVSMIQGVGASVAIATGAESWLIGANLCAVGAFLLLESPRKSRGGVLLRDSSPVPPSGARSDASHGDRVCE